MTIDVQKVTASELTPQIIGGFVDARASFQVVAVTNLSSVVNSIEGQIEKRSLKCRIFTEGRKALIGASFFGPTAIGGVAATAAIAVHNLATLNPDYEIGKNKLMGTVTVTYKK